MTEEGKRLFKIAGMGLGGLIGLMLIIRVISSFTGGGGSREDLQNVPGEDPFAQIKQGEDVGDKEIVFYSSKGRLINLLHSRAFNDYRSQRFKDAIRLWEIAAYLDPKDMRVQIRLDEAKRTLSNLIDTNAAIGIKDYEALRFERAIEFYQRAANYAADFDDDKFRYLQKQIILAERKMAR